jgi:hypothetical protein
LGWAQVVAGGICPWVVIVGVLVGHGDGLGTDHAPVGECSLL